MKNRLFFSLALAFLALLTAPLAADAQTASKPAKPPLDPQTAAKLAQACQHLLLSADQGLEQLDKLTHNLANLNKQYHRDRDVWETSWKTLNKEAERYKQTHAKWWAHQAPCNEETELKMAMAGRFFMPWKKVRSPFESVRQYELRMSDREWEERKKWGRDIPECIEAERLWNTEVAPTLAALKEPEIAYSEMTMQFEQTGKRYEALYDRYKEIMFNHFWAPSEPVRSIESSIVDEFKKVRTQFPKMEDYFTSETLYGYLSKIQNAKKTADVLCRERLALPPPPPPPSPTPDPRVKEAEKAIVDCDFDRAKTLIGRLPAGSGRTKLEEKLSVAMDREKRVRKLWDEAAKAYEEAQIEDKAGHPAQSRAAYDRTLQKLKAASSETKCDHRKRQILLSTGIVSDRLNDLNKPVRPEWLSDDEVKAFIRELDVQYLQKWLRQWCPTTRTNCAVVPMEHAWGGLYNQAWWARTREKQGIVRRIAACMDPYVMDVKMKEGDRKTKIRKCYDDNPIPR